MLSDAERCVLNTALEQYRPGQSGPILVGGGKVLKAALQLMTKYRLVIEEMRDGKPLSSYTRWVDVVQVGGLEDQEVYVGFNPMFEHVWLAAKRTLVKSFARNPANLGLRSKYAIRLYDWAKKQSDSATVYIRLEVLREILGLVPVRDETGKVVREAALQPFPNFRQRALDVAINQINGRTDLSISIKSLSQEPQYGRVTGVELVIRRGRKPSK